VSEDRVQRERLLERATRGRREDWEKAGKGSREGEEKAKRGL
jgi:hypothetical protein